MTDEALLHRCLSGDDQAFSSLVTRYQDRLLGMCHRVLEDREDALDAFQEILLRVHRGLRNFQGQSRFSTWLYRLAMNTCIDCRRRRNRWRGRVTLDPEMLAQMPERNPETVWEETFDTRVIDQVMQRLPAEQRHLLTMRDLEQQSNESVARSLGVGVGALKARLHRARRTLRRELARGAEIRGFGSMAFTPTGMLQ